MSASFSRSDNHIYVGDYLGSCFDSPSSDFAIGWYCTKKRGRIDDKSFVLIKNGSPVVWGEVASRIFEGRVADTGRFALHLVGKTNQSTVRLFEPNGQEFGSKQFRDGLVFFDLSADGRFLFSHCRSDLICVDLETMKEAFRIQLEHRFGATAAKLDSDGATLLLRHCDKDWYRFDQSGSFLDREKWLHDYMKDCDGSSLFQIVERLHKQQGTKDAEEARSYVQWVEEALRRGIADSYHLKATTVYEFLSKLHTEAGELDKAAVADGEAEGNLDGFRLVDRAVMRVKEIGNPLDRELADQLISDLERATKTERLLEYPNYVAKLFRCKGEVLELLGETEGAIAAYNKALEANPQAGCKNRLERLTNSPVVSTEKPEVKRIEDRVPLEKLTMFHFRCPACGATPKEVGMQNYLENWRNADSARLGRLFSFLATAMVELKKSRSNSANNFLKAGDDLIAVLAVGLKDEQRTQSPLLADAAPKTMFIHSDCPICEKRSGLRRKDNYFTVWSDACRVQGSNLFYEVGAILMGLTRLNPAWLEDQSRAFCDKVCKATFEAGEAIGLMSCPQCGRFTTCLYGGTRSEPEKGMCRWCLDVVGTKQITINIDLSVSQDGGDPHFLAVIP